MSAVTRRGFLIGTLTTVPLASDARAIQRNWLLLGIATLRRAQEIIEIRITSWQRSFSHIKLGVRKNDAHLISGVRMNELMITFADGETLKTPLQAVVAIGHMTPPVKLADRKRSIRRVQLTYALAPSRRFVDRTAQATIELWGRR